MRWQFLYLCKNQTQSFSSLFRNFLLILESLPVTIFKDPKEAILALKCYLWFCNILQEAACDKLILVHFPFSQWEVGAREY